MRVAIVGLGFFAQFHIDAWLRLGQPFSIAGVADPDGIARDRYQALLRGVPRYDSLPALLEECRPDVVDIVTRPDSHKELAEVAFGAGANVISQKPMAPSWQESEAMVRLAETNGVRLMVHDNWRFQPWYEAIKVALEQGAIGTPFLAHYRVRPGDGRGSAPFTAQPYFSQMPRFFFYETGIHFVDLTRFLFGDITAARGVRRQIRSDIAGEDMGLALLTTETGVEVILDGNRWSEAPETNPAFGTVSIEGTGGQIRVSEEGVVTIKQIGGDWRALFTPDLRGDPYRGDSVFRTIRHLGQALLSGDPSPMEGWEYLKTMRVVFDLYPE